jgi:integrase
MKKTLRKTPKWPLIVKERGVEVKIYRTKYRKKNRGAKSRQYQLHTLAYYIGKERRRETFADLSKAKARAGEVIISMLQGRLPVLQLTSADSESYSRAIQLLRPLGLPLHAAVEEYVAARSKLDGESLASAVSEHLARKRNIPQRSVSEIVDEMLAAKKHDGLSARYLYMLGSDLTRFKNAFKTNIGSITSTMIDDWLAAQNVTARTRNNLRAAVITLFNFGKSRGYLPKGQPTEADDSRRAKDRGGKIGILTPKQLALLLKDAPPEIQVYLAIGAFAGVRTSEIMRLDWSDVSFERGHITVSPEKAKTATRRLVPILPNLAQWLALYRGRKGKVATLGLECRTIACARQKRIKWPHNALRHSYASYRLAATGDAARTSLELGNSATLLFRNYREIADEHDAAAWFAIAPKRPKNVIAMAR